MVIMRQRKSIVILLILMALLPLGFGAGPKEAKSASPAKNSPRPDRMAWYREAKFGMFIHWGPYSLASVEASWPIMQPAKEGPRRDQRGGVPGAAAAVQPWAV